MRQCTCLKPRPGPNCTMDTREYFQGRAPRYRTALRGCPNARLLDLLPYCAAIACSGPVERGDLALDAFGGTGFLADSLNSAGLEFVIADCSPGMLGVKNRHQVHVTNEDFKDIRAFYGRRAFRLVVSHGGFHHVLENADIPNAGRSRDRQRRILDVLSDLVAVGGIVMIADIPDQQPSEVEGCLLDQALDRSTMEKILGKDAVEQVMCRTGMSFAESKSLRQVAADIAETLVAKVDWEVPRLFFDEYVAKCTPMGHVAVYPDFDAIHDYMTKKGFLSEGRINYVGPWSFANGNEAGWFFKEKFSVGDPSEPGEDKKAETEMLSILRKYLGVRVNNDFTNVNWGVTYAAYRRVE